MQTHRLADLDPKLTGASLTGARIAVYASLDQCETAWREAVNQCACYVFQTFDWHAAWRDTIGRSEHVEPCIVHLIAPDGRTLLMLPFGVYRHGALRSLRFLGEPVTDYNAPLIDRAFAQSLTAPEFARLWRIVLRLVPKVDVVWLTRMPKTIEGTANPLAALSRLTHTDDAFAATLPSDFSAFAAARSTQFFSQNRRYRRRLEKIDAVEARFPQDSAERSETVRILAEQKSQWLRTSGLRDMFERPEYRAFYERLTNSPLQAGGIVVAALRVGGVTVATMWGPVFRTRYYFLLTSYREDWTRYSVGRLLMESVVQWCIAQKTIDVFDLTAGDEGYKQSWSDHSVPLYEHLAFRTAKGAAFVGWRRFRNSLRSNRRLRELVRRVTTGLRAQRGATPEVAPT